MRKNSRFLSGPLMHMKQNGKLEFGYVLQNTTVVRVERFVDPLFTVPLVLISSPTLMCFFKILFLQFRGSF